MTTFTVTDAIIAKTRKHLDTDYFSEIKGNFNEIASAAATLNTSKMNIAGSNATLPAYADNAAALADDAPVGSLYSNASGAVFVVLAA